MADDAFPLRPELLDDFFAECDEQLGNTRHQLGTLTTALAEGRSSPAAIESVYRSFHSFKGNAAIVGLSQAEALAHAAENLLRQITRGELALVAAHVDLLTDVASRLDQMVASFRLSQPAPDANDLLAALAVFQTGAEKSAAATEPAVSAAATSGSSEGERLPADAVRDRGLLPWRARFTPTPELDARGVNVSSIRTRLAELGEIVSGTPSVTPGEGIRFEFLLGVRQPPENMAAWETDGVQLSPDVTPAPLPPVATSGLGATETAAAALSSAPSHIVRVDLSRLDELMRITGDIVIQRSQLQERIQQATGERAPLLEVNQALGRSLRDLRQAVMRVRLVPAQEMFSRLPYVVRDLDREAGRRTRVVLQGEQVEIDKYIVERLREPLLHLVRNAVSHGIESPEERAAAGKPPEATLTLVAATEGNRVRIDVRDDGRGVDAARVLARAAELGLPIPAEADEAALLDLLCASGFSTRSEADRAAGRGVGMAVVAATVRELGGSLTLSTQLGTYTQFTLRLPLTLSIADAFIVQSGGQRCAIPQTHVQEAMQIEPAEIRLINGAEVIPYRGALAPLLRLNRLFAHPPVPTDLQSVVVLGAERGPMGLAVDRVVGQREIVVRPAHDPLVRVPGIAGATELGDGKPVLVLDPLTLSAAIARRADPRLPQPAPTVVPA